MLHKNKKGISVEFLAGTIIVLIGFFVIGGGIMVFKDKLPSAEADQICKTSVAAAAKSKINIPGGHISLSSIYCKTQEFTIDAKGKTDNQIMTEFLNYAARAWNIWGEGTYSAGIYTNFLMFGSDKCFRYYNIKIKNLDREIKYTKLERFMKDTEYKKTGKKYWEYFHQNTGTSLFVFFEESIKNQQIYSIMFADIRMKNPLEKTVHYNGIFISNLNRRSLPTGTAGVPWWFFFTIVPIPDHTTYCDILSSTGDN